MAEHIFVIGHVNPDTDTIAAAMGYAWLLKERDGGDIVAARAGAINPQTSWVMKRLGLDPPILLNDASPRFDTVTRPLDTSLPDAPLRAAWDIASPKLFSKRPSSILAVAEPILTTPRARRNALGKRSPLSGKFSSALWVSAPQ